MKKKVCPAKHCKKVISADYAFCPRHWFMLSNELRAKIRTLFETERGSVDHLQALADARKLIEVREAMIRKPTKREIK